MTEKDKKCAEEMGLLTPTEHVNHPAHYQGKHECIEVMRLLFGDQAVEDFCRLTAFKYRFRTGRKDGEPAEKDIAKAEWYEDYLIQMREEERTRYANYGRRVNYGKD